MEAVKYILKLVTIEQVLGALFAIMSLIMLIFLVFKSTRTLITQLIGALLVVAISLYADSKVVYTIALFVVATLVTELEFLEKIAALIWNRKEYWNYLLDRAKKVEITNKAKEEVEAEIRMSQLEGLDEVEAEDESIEAPDGLTDINDTTTIQDRSKMVQEALLFEQITLNNLMKENIPFLYENLKKEVKIESRSNQYILDAIIETKKTHFILKIKNSQNIASLISACDQLNINSHAYKEFLSERKINVNIQPLIIIPHSVGLPNNINGIPIVKFDMDRKSFSNLQYSYSYSDHEGTDSIDDLLLRFLKEHSAWAFSPLRIQTWGAKQNGYHQLRRYPISDIRNKLVELVENNKVKTTISKKGNTLYKILD